MLTATEAVRAWSEVLKSPCRATFFHTRAWAEILEATFSSWKASPLALRFPDGNHAVVPLMRRRLLGVGPYYYESMLPGVYGGPLFLRDGTTEQWEAVWSALACLRNVVLLGNPYRAWTIAPRLETRAVYTHVLDLSRGFAAVSRGFSKGHRADISAARRDGVTLREASCEADVDRYYELYQESLARWGSGAGGFYPKKLFLAMLHRPEFGSAIKLWTAYYRGSMIGGAWMFSWSDHVVYWHGASNSEGRKFHAAHAIVSAAMLAACEGGYRWFDFNPSGGLRGVETFKAAFGAQRVEFRYYRMLDVFGKVQRACRFWKQKYLKRCGL